MDNATNEYGVAAARYNSMQKVVSTTGSIRFNVEERVDSRVKGTGLRSDGDDGLSPETHSTVIDCAFYIKRFRLIREPVCAPVLKAQGTEPILSQ
jgi:hypothetical protein